MSANVPAFQVPRYQQQHQPAIYDFDHRIFALLSPFRSASLRRFNPADRTPLNDRVMNLDAKIHVLIQNLSFLAHRHDANTARIIAASDVFLVARGSIGYSGEDTTGAIFFLVRYQDEFITVVKVTVEARASVIDALCTKADELISARLETSVEVEV